jgi:5-formyltetrahydrofolate cyclo-ligase
MAQNKSEWRRVLLAARSALPEEARRAGSTAIADRVRALPFLAAARAILGYKAIGAEVDLRSLLAAESDRRVPSFVPLPGCASERPRWTGASVSTISADTGVSAQDLVFPVVVLVPGVGFDSSGMRLGRGAGFYDRALAELRRHGPVYAVGVAFECQVVDSLPSDPWDQRMDAIVSEQRTWSAGDGTTGGGAAIAS